MQVNSSSAEGSSIDQRPPQRSAVSGWVWRCGNLISQMCWWTASASILLITFICGINVARRYLFGSAWSWAEEAMLYLMIVIVFLGAVTATWHGIHLALDMLVKQVPPSARRIIGGLSATVTCGILALCSGVSFQVVKLLYDYNQKSQALEIWLWIPQSMVCISFGLMALLGLMRFALTEAAFQSDEGR